MSDVGEVESESHFLLYTERECFQKALKYSGARMIRTAVFVLMQTRFSIIVLQRFGKNRKM